MLYKSSLNKQVKKVLNKTKNPLILKSDYYLPLKNKEFYNRSITSDVT